jgi:hypothetical protein
LWDDARLEAYDNRRDTVTDMLGVQLVDTRFKTYQQHCFAILDNLKVDRSSYSEDTLEKR